MKISRIFKRNEAISSLYNIQTNEAIFSFTTYVWRVVGSDRETRPVKPMDRVTVISILSEMGAPVEGTNQERRERLKITIGLGNKI